MKPPREYDGNRTHYREWREVFHAYLSAHDPQFTKVLLWVEELGRRAFRSEDLLDLSADLDLSAEDLIECKTSLYTMLTTYTSGSVKASVRRFRPKGVLEAYRELHFEGLKLTPKAVFLEKSLLWRVEEASMDKAQESIERWEAVGFH